MAVTTVPASKARGATGAGVVCLVAGVVFGALSVYSDSRAACALWVLVALAFTFVSGLIIAPASKIMRRDAASDR